MTTRTRFELVNTPDGMCRSLRRPTEKYLANPRRKPLVDSPADRRLYGEIMDIAVALILTHASGRTTVPQWQYEEAEELSGQDDSASLLAKARVIFAGFPGPPIRDHMTLERWELTITSLPVATDTLMQLARAS